MPSPLITRLIHRLFGAPLLRNSIRGELVEEMVAQALEPGWALCADDWGACDLRQVGGPSRIQVKPSAARQSWPRRDVERQQGELRTVFGHAHCHRCNRETRLVDVA